MSNFFLALNVFLAIYAFWGAFYQLFFSIAGKFYKTPIPKEAIRSRRIAVFIPAYKEDAVIVQTVEAALQQDYPTNQYEVVVIADSLKPETIKQLKKMPVQVMDVAFEKSTKSKSLKSALNKLRYWNFEIAIVLDADNIMKTDFLNRINNSFAQGVRVLQGRRLAKNQETGLALLDSASEDANTHILSKGHRAFGLSARLSGSGMAFDYSLFAQNMQKINAIGGFDKELELRLTQAGEVISYDDEAIVYDEKVSYARNFTRQRSRWIAAQFYYAQQFMPIAMIQFILKGSFDFLNKSVQMILPPRLILPFVLSFGFLFNYLVSNDLAFFWALGLGSNIMSFALALPKYCFNFSNLKMWKQIPIALWATLRALTQLKNAQREFIHTVHSV